MAWSFHNNEKLVQALVSMGLNLFVCPRSTRRVRVLQKTWSFLNRRKSLLHSEDHPMGFKAG
jgi:hypothetical protein